LDEPDFEEPLLDEDADRERPRFAAPAFSVVAFSGSFLAGPGDALRRFFRRSSRSDVEELALGERPLDPTAIFLGNLISRSLKYTCLKFTWNRQLEITEKDQN
jgi:hypothetical protein